MNFDVVDPSVMSAPTHDASVTVRSLLRVCGIQDLLDTPGITEVAVNRPGEAWVEAGGRWQFHALASCTYDRLGKLARALTVYAKVQPPLSAQSPIKPVMLPDGQRGQVVIAPACEPGTVSLTIRVPSSRRYSLDELIASGRLSGYRHVLADGTELGDGDFLPDRAVEGLRDVDLQLLQALQRRDLWTFLSGVVRQGLNVVLVGGTGSGKTTLMKALADLVDPSLRVATIEDTHELPLTCQPNHVHLFYGETLSATEIVKTTLRMKFDRVYLAELRGNETWDYLTLLNTGHAGGMTTLHANDALCAFARIATLVKQSPVGQSMDWGHVQREVRGTIDVVLFLSRHSLTQVFFDPAAKRHLLMGVAP